ncbi:MAG: hypothetical protein PHD76_07615 [Methylacidiphilales bacterium]|nr:hypothetical protein [Candidatus Methylacidiphilales bacterium]
MKLFKLFPAFILVLGAIGAGLAFGQTDFAVGSIIKGFELPQRDKQGNLQLKIFGKEATVMSKNRIQVHGLSIDIYSGGKAGTKMTSDECDYWSEEKRLTSNNGVKVVQPSFVLTAKNMDWDLQGSRGIFKENVLVVITQRNAALVTP